MMRRSLFLMLPLLLLSACTPRRTAPREVSETAGAKPARVFLPAVPPTGIAREELRGYMLEHYWDRFDFSDTLFIAEIDTSRMLEAFALYVGSFLSPDEPAPMKALMERAGSSGPMLRYFGMLAERVLYDPNSPLRSDELYIPVLEALSESPLLDEWEKIAPQHELRLAKQNRIGARANDFRYTLADGTSGRLSDIQADYVLLFIYNPGCAMCKQLREDIVGSPMLNERTERGELKILALYPDEDLAAWHAYRDRIPPRWINAYDATQQLREQELYDLKAIPALYLLDRDKRVLVKDGTDVGQIEWTIDHR